MAATEREERQRVVSVARSFLGTPYHDMGRIKGVGVDCATVIAMVFEEAGLEGEFAIPNYSPQWYMHRNEELYLKQVLDRALEIAEADALPGDVVLYRFGRCFAHGAIIVDPGWPTVIHAHRPARAVVLGEGDQGDLAADKLGPRPRRFFTRKAWHRG